MKYEDVVLSVCVFYRLCRLAQDTKQEAEDSASLKKSIKPEPATREEEKEEAVDVKVSTATEIKNDVEAKPQPGK